MNTTMIRPIKTLSRLAACAALGVSLSAGAGVFDDAVFMLQGDLDANGDGVVTKGEALNALARGDSANALSLDVRGSHDGTNAGVSNGLATVVMPRRGRTIQSRVMHFKSIASRYASGTDAVWANGLALKTGFPMSEKMEMSAVIRFRWDGFVTDVDGATFSDTGATLLTYGHGNSTDNNGVRCMIKKNTDGSGYLFFYNWAWTFDFSIKDSAWKIETGKWYDLAFTVKKGSLTAYLFPQGHWDYASVLSKTTSNEKIFSGGSFASGEDSFGIAMATAHVAGNDFAYPKETWSSTALDSHQLDFNGDIHQVAVWSRVLSASEVEEAFMGGESADCQIGVVNGSANEFASTAADGAVWTETDGWFRMKGQLNAGESTSWRLVNRETKAHNRFLRLSLCAAAADGEIELSIDGTAVGTKALAGVKDVTFGIPSDIVTPGGTHDFKLTLKSGSAIAIDAITIGGGFSIKCTGSEANNSGHLLDEDYKNFTTYLTGKSGHSYKNRLVYRFSLLPAFADCRTQWTFTRNAYAGDNAAGYAVYLNDKLVHSSAEKMPTEWKFVAPAGSVQGGLNTLVISNTTSVAGTDTAYYNITSVTGEPIFNKGLVLIVR